MNAQELRINNWVLFPPNMDAKVIIPTVKGKIAAINLFGEVIIDNCPYNHIHMFTVPIKHIAPIPLTPEILEMAGFKKHHALKHGLRKAINFDMDIIVYFLYNKVQFYINGTELRHITHIHQLQNLIFALTGTELNIKL
jgi:hypothetical protein